MDIVEIDSRQVKPVNGLERIRRSQESGIHKEWGEGEGRGEIGWFSQKREEEVKWRMGYIVFSGNFRILRS